MPNLKLFHCNFLIEEVESTKKLSYLLENSYCTPNHHQSKNITKFPHKNQHNLHISVTNVEADRIAGHV